MINVLKIIIIITLGRGWVGYCILRLIPWQFSGNKIFLIISSIIRRRMFRSGFILLSLYILRGIISFIGCMLRFGSMMGIMLLLIKYFLGFRRILPMILLRVSRRKDLLVIFRRIQSLWNVKDLIIKTLSRVRMSSWI